MSCKFHIVLLNGTLKGCSSDQSLAFWERFILLQAPKDVLPFVLKFLAQSFFCHICGLLRCRAHVCKDSWLHRVYALSLLLGSHLKGTLRDSKLVVMALCSIVVDPLSNFLFEWVLAWVSIGVGKSRVRHVCLFQKRIVLMQMSAHLWLLVLQLGRQFIAKFELARGVWILESHALWDYAFAAVWLLAERRVDLSTMLNAATVHSRQWLSWSISCNHLSQWRLDTINCSLASVVFMIFV